MEIEDNCKVCETDSIILEELLQALNDCKNYNSLGLNDVHAEL